MKIILLQLWGFPQNKKIIPNLHVLHNVLSHWSQIIPIKCEEPTLQSRSQLNFLGNHINGLAILRFH